jgi:tRNA(His) guanylyltransferase
VLAVLAAEGENSAMSSVETMGARQKRFEPSGRLMPGLPVVARMDGRAFHTYTRGLPRPFSEGLHAAMIDATAYLVEHFHASIGYTQSDEISLCWRELDTFDGREQKLASLLAAAATWAFGEAVRVRLPEKVGKPALFDARIWAVPSADVVVEHFVWREADATRNSLTMLAQAHFSHKQLQGVKSAGKHDMLHGIGINWNDQPEHFKRGSFVRRRLVERMLTEAELERIPAKHRPTGPVTRSETVRVAAPPLRSIENAAGFLLDGEEP